MSKELNKEMVEFLKDIFALKNPKTIEAFLKIDRVDFVPDEKRAIAYGDSPISIGYGQTISQPFTVAFMIELLDVVEGNEILDVGSGSGWTTALLGYLAGEGGSVLGLEIIPELVEFGRRNVRKTNLKNIEIQQALEEVGFPGKKFDRILVSAEDHDVPEDLLEQLKPGGILVVPIFNSVWKFFKSLDGKIIKEEHSGFAFVPLIRKR